MPISTREPFRKEMLGGSLHIWLPKDVQTPFAIMLRVYSPEDFFMKESKLSAQQRALDRLNLFLTLFPISQPAREPEGNSLQNTFGDVTFPAHFVAPSHTE